MRLVSIQDVAGTGAADDMDKMGTRPTAVLLLAATTFLPALAEKRVDLDAVYRIKSEALQNSKVMEHLSYLTDVYGPRVTNSPGFFAAADWVVKTASEVGHSGASGRRR
jgi:carboxypeptidase Q